MPMPKVFGIPVPPAQSDPKMLCASAGTAARHANPINDTTRVIRIEDTLRLIESTRLRCVASLSARCTDVELPVNVARANAGSASQGSAEYGANDLASLLRDACPLDGL